MHWVGVFSSILMVLWIHVSAIWAFLHNLNLATGVPPVQGWAPSATIIALPGILIAGGVVNSRLNPPAPVMQTEPLPHLPMPQ
jgi:hypothetical protein